MLIGWKTVHLEDRWHRVLTMSGFRIMLYRISSAYTMNRISKKEVSL